ncbi:MAG: glycosyltransferase family 2 protein [Leptolyngbyaceae cyanobacterium bins.59]|nr:glycosyltransferase family 2 protein [Leptolyngbyaceae cyanobacterium bins.59]
MTLPLSVITVTHNHAAYIGRCLEALVPEVDRVGGEVILIDNRSDDESAEIIRRYPTVHLHVNQGRHGFSVNNNRGMAIAQGRYLLLLNPDTEVHPGALQTLIDFMDTYPEVGMCGAQLKFPDGTVQPSPRRFPTFGSTLIRRTPLRLFLRHSRFNRQHLMLDVDHSQPRPVDWLLGACLFVRREVVEQVGPLDEGFFLYVEDIDWARRMHDAGWEIYYVPTATITHHHLAVSDKKFFSRYTWLHIQSMIRYIRKYLLPPIPGVAIRGYRSEVWRSTLRETESTRPV